jgi:HlyD family secretion protein
VEEFEGVVRTLSADSISQGMLDTSAYLVQVDIGDLPEGVMAMLKPGMPAEMFVQTGTRTPFEYVTEPITDFLNKAAL